MSLFNKTDAAFAAAVLASLGLSLALGLALAPRQKISAVETSRPVLPEVPPGYDPFAVDRAAVSRIASSLDGAESGKAGALLQKITSSLSGESPDFLAAEEALADLAGLGEKATPAALQLLDDPRPELRRAGARLAGAAGAVLLVPEIVKGLEDELWEVQADCALALGLAGDRSAVIDLLMWRAERLNKRRNPVVTVRVAEALLNLGNTSNVPQMIASMFASPFDKVFEADLAATALQLQSGAPVFFDREATISARDAAANEWASWWLEGKRFFRPRRPSPDRTDRVRLAARMRFLLENLGGAKYFNLYQTLEIAAAAGDLAAPWLVDCLYSESDQGDAAAHARVNACEAFRLMYATGGQPAPDRALLAPELMRVLGSDKSPAVRAGCARVLALLSDRRSVKPLLAALSSDPDPSVRIESARALGRLGFSDAVRPLEAADPGKDPVLAFEIASALEECRRADGVGPVVAALEKGVRDPSLRGLAEEARLRLRVLTGRRSPIPDKPAELEAYLESWRRTVEARRVLAALRNGTEEAAADAASIKARLSPFLGPEVPFAPEPGGELRFFVRWGSTWQVLFDLRQAVETSNIAAVAGLALELEKITGRPSGMHPRSPLESLTEALDSWESWALENGPGCRGAARGG